MFYSLRMVAVASVVFMSGCSSIGASDYGCSGMPVGVGCTPSRELYQQTNGGATPVQNAEKKSEEKRKLKNSESSKSDGTGVVTDRVIDTFVTPQLPDEPVPIRTPSVVMRIWVGTWEDSESGALMAPGYVYSEIEPRRWVIGKPESAARASSQAYKPLEPTSENSKVNVKKE